MTEQVQKLTIKLLFGKDIRRWRSPDSCEYQALTAFVQKTFQLSDFYLQFEDDENDRLTLASQQEFDDAVECTKDEGRKSLKIIISKGSLHAVPKPTKPICVPPPSSNCAGQKCCCGASLQKIAAESAYKWCSFVVCDGCKKECRRSTPVYNCPLDRSSFHPHGYDLCSDCYFGVEKPKKADRKKGKKCKKGRKSKKFCKEQTQWLTDATACQIAREQAWLQQIAANFNAEFDDQRSLNHVMNKVLQLRVKMSKEMKRSAKRRKQAMKRLKALAERSAERWPKKSSAPAAFNCPGAHGLASFPVHFRCITCDVCDLRVPANENAHGCRLCDFDVCDDCFAGKTPVSQESEKSKSVTVEVDFELEPLPKPVRAAKPFSIMDTLISMAEDDQPVSMPAVDVEAEVNMDIEDEAADIENDAMLAMVLGMDMTEEEKRLNGIAVAVAQPEPEPEPEPEAQAEEEVVVAEAEIEIELEDEPDDVPQQEQAVNMEIEDENEVQAEMEMELELVAAEVAVEKEISKQAEMADTTDNDAVLAMLLGMDMTEAEKRLNGIAIAKERKVSFEIEAEIEPEIEAEVPAELEVEPEPESKDDAVIDMVLDEEEELEIEPAVVPVYDEEQARMDAMDRLASTDQKFAIAAKASQMKALVENLLPNLLALGQVDEAEQVAAEEEVVEEVEEIERFAYEAELNSVLDMGYSDIESIQLLLVKHEGNVRLVFNEL